MSEVDDEVAKQRAAERRVVRKVDLLLMPLLTITLGLQYYDKAVLGNAAVFGIIKDLQLSEVKHGKTVTTRYSTATAAFYYGYICAVLPISLLIARLPLPQTCSALILLWGITCILTVVCHDYPGFVAQRVALGVAESVVGPAFVLVTTMWYKPYEQATRMGIWYSATGIFSMISGLINFGLGHTHMAHPWKAMYYFCGSVTIAWAFVVFFLLPVSPLEPGRFFNEHERVILARRFEENPYGRGRQPWKLYQVREAVLDLKTWVYMLMGGAIYLCNGSVTAFGARIIASFGYNSLQTTALLIPGGFVTCITIYFFSYFADRYRNLRTLLLPLSCIPVLIGALVIWLAPWHPRIGPLIGYYLVAAFGAPYVLLLTLAAGNTLGTTKKAFTTGCIFVGYVAGNIGASYTVLTQEQPIKYRSTWITVIVAMVFSSLASIFLRYLYIRENNRRDQVAERTPRPPHTGTVDLASTINRPDAEDDKNLPGGDPGLESQQQKYQDLTDEERLDFRYQL